jgi:enoyl-CoA hydratase/carnithine racemase
MDIALTRTDDGVFVATWRDGENRLNLDSLARLNEILDEVEASTGPAAFVLTGEGKFFSNGLDLGRFGHNPTELLATLEVLKRTIGRLLVLPVWTVAAINGHCFAGGGLLSMGFDERVMRDDRGFWCMNEAEIGMRLEDDLWSILANRLPKATVVKAAATAHRFAGPDAHQWGIVEELAAEAEVVPRAVALAQGRAHLDRATLRHHKNKAHGDEARYLGYEF